MKGWLKRRPFCLLVSFCGQSVLRGVILRFALKSTTYIDLQRAQCGTDTELPVIKCYGSYASLQARFTRPQIGGLLNKTTALGFNLRDYTVYPDPQTGGADS